MVKKVERGEYRGHAEMAEMPGRSESLSARQ
jgi:hypothetical protein